MTVLSRILLLLSPALMVGAGVLAAASEQDHPMQNRDGQLAELGRVLFHDPALSRNGTQSCATCHDPDHAFTDPRESLAGRAVSVGADGASHGDRNTPTLSYAFLSPDFHRDAKGNYKGGQFWDGRADNLRDQAGQPMLNPVEMAMPDRATVIDRLRADPTYVQAFAAVFGPGALDDVELAFDHAAEALAAYQSTEEFAPFDSRFDRYLRGEAKLTAQEQFGHTVFITWNCRLCHQLQQQGITERETFTSFEYHNIGVPVNHAVRSVSGLGRDHVDLGLLARPGIDDPAQAGRIKVPTLRNVAVTAPYMHNGVFEDLRTAVLFYNKYTSRRPAAKINPETGKEWGDPEVAENLSLAELQSGLMLDDARVDALIAFLKTLTDRRYEPLLAEQDRTEQEAVAAR
ncbi:methylamine utilization protein MauG [Paracoccus acridae]|uniref:Methylamine utilization protein MauG n=1 Tax=Paracoccus acridae TaxID=1795310 RepID=A0ABQ1VLV9_9RHOB|nr:cytochrome c peroxidase [Paracoccus acridae]GGF79821.1 methylamine utilization protein MauG [Paracoccus acridae]